MTQAELARRTGLAPATVSNIVHALRESGVVAVTDGEPQGRRGRGVRLARSTGYVLGVDFDHRRVSVAVANLAREVLAERSRRLTAGHRHEDGLAAVAKLLAEVAAVRAEAIAPAPQILALLRPTHGADLTIADVIAAAERGDVGARRVLADTGRTLGVAVANLCNILNPEVILVGGELSQAGEMLLGPLRDIVARYGVPGAVRDVEIKRAELGEGAELLGAVALALLDAPVQIPFGG